MSRRGLNILLILYGVLGAVNANAMTISVDKKDIPGLVASAPMNVTTLRLTGMFEIGDSDKLHQILVGLGPARDAPTVGPLATAELSSIGGDVVEGVKIGYLLHQFKVATLVRRGDICLSACALAFLGGTASDPLKGTTPDRRIEVGGQVGFHNIALNFGALTNLENVSRESATSQGFGLALGGSSLIVRYAADMGISADLIGRILGRPPTEFDYVDRAGKFLSLRVCPTEPLVPRLSREQQAANICNNSLGPSGPAPSGQVRELSAREARLRMLNHIERNASALGVADRFAEGLRTVISSKNDSLIAQVYDSLKALGLPLPNIAGYTYEVQGYTVGMYQMACIASFSASEADRFDLVILGPKGLAPPTRAAPETCRWLFRFDHEDMINPPK